MLQQFGRNFLSAAAVVLIFFFLLCRSVLSLRMLRVTLLQITCQSIECRSRHFALTSAVSPWDIINKTKNRITLHQSMPCHIPLPLNPLNPITLPLLQVGSQLRFQRNTFILILSRFGHSNRYIFLLLFS